MTALLALASSLLWGTADFLGGTATRRRSAYAVIGGSQALALVMLLPVAIVTGGFRATLGYLPWALASGLVGLIALAAFYSALATGTMGVVAPVAATSVVVPVAVGLAQGDAPSVLQVVGILAAVAGAVLASGPRASSEPRASSRPLLLALVAAGGFGAVTVFLAMGARSSVIMTLVTMRAETLAILLTVVAATGRRSGLRRADLPLLAAIGFGDAAANATYSLATLTGQLSVVAVLGSLYPAVTVLLAREIHGERLRRLQTVGVTMALGGVVLIGAGGGTG